MPQEDATQAKFLSGSLPHTHLSHENHGADDALVIQPKSRTSSPSRGPPPQAAGRSAASCSISTRNNTSPTATEPNQPRPRSSSPLCGPPRTAGQSITNGSLRPHCTTEARIPYNLIPHQTVPKGCSPFILFSLNQLTTATILIAETQ